MTITRLPIGSYVRMKREKSVRTGFQLVPTYYCSHPDFDNEGKLYGVGHFGIGETAEQAVAGFWEFLTTERSYWLQRKGYETTPNPAS